MKVKNSKPETELITKAEYEETMKRLMDIQIAADAAVRSINNLKALIASTF